MLCYIIGFFLFFFPLKYVCLEEYTRAIAMIPDGLKTYDKQIFSSLDSSNLSLYIS